MMIITFFITRAAKSLQRATRSEQDYHAGEHCVIDQKSHKIAILHVQTVLQRAQPDGSAAETEGGKLIADIYQTTCHVYSHFYMRSYLQKLNPRYSNPVEIESTVSANLERVGLAPCKCFH